ncbi:hypothetical protein B0H13DRAFT_2345941 [Mycena leptocephala]|nr:hypothetical protein B0H13DRAFT_2345941 [Mycena leptocephala]
MRLDRSSCWYIPLPSSSSSSSLRPALSSLAPIRAHADTRSCYVVETLLILKQHTTSETCGCARLHEGERADYLGMVSLTSSLALPYGRVEAGTSGRDERPCACGTANRWWCPSVPAQAFMGKSIQWGRSCVARRAIHAAEWPSQTTSAITCIHRGLVVPAAPILRPAPSSSCASPWLSPRRSAPAERSRLFVFPTYATVRSAGDPHQGHEAVALICPHDHPLSRYRLSRRPRISRAGGKPIT